MKKNLIFKLCFIVGIFLIILTACDLGTKQWANITFSLEGPAIEQARANSGASSSARYIHPYASSLKFELFSGKELLDSQTISIQSGTKSISITVKGVPLNDPNLRAEIEVWGTMTGGPLSILGQNSIHLGRIGLGYTKLSLGVKPVSGANVAYQEDKQGQWIYLDIPPDTSADTFNIEMLPKKGLYTLESSVDNIYLYNADGKNYKNSIFINNEEGPKTLVFYHPEDKASTYYAYFESQEVAQPWLDGTKLEQDILITRYDDRDMIVGSEEGVYFDQLSPEISFTIYNPYPFTLNLTNTIENADEYLDSEDKFNFEGFPGVLVLLPGESKKFTVNFHDPDFDSTTYSVKSTISAPGLKDFVLLFTGTGSGT